MIGMNAEEERVIFLEHRTQLWRDALRQENRNARADAQELHMRNRPQLAQKKLQLFVTQEQRVAAAQQDITDGWGPPDVIDLAIELGVKIVAGGVADQARASAVTTIAGTAIGHQKQHPIRVTM